MNKQSKRAGLIHIGFDTANLNGETNALRIATKSALSQISNIHAERILFCIEGNENTTEMKDITVSADVAANSMPNANIAFGATISKSTGDRIRVLMLASDVPIE